MSGNHLQELETRLWAAADELRANSDLTAQQYSGPVLGLIFLRYADARFSAAQEELEKAGTKSRRRKGVSKTDYHARGVLFLPEEARFSTLLNLPEGGNLGASVNEAMKAIERENEELKDVLPKTFHRIQNTVLASLLKNFNAIPMDLEGDAFGKIYEYFLGKFAMSEGQRGGEFFTPTSLVKLIVEIIEPFHGRIFDPACGSGGMFVQSAAFVKNHHKAASEEISVYGQERVAETVRLCKMNLAVHGLSGDIRQGNSYYEDLHESTGRFDFVMANPPFNVDKVDKDRLKDDTRFPFGMPRVDNANYLWIQYFYSALTRRAVPVSSWPTLPRMPAPPSWKSASSLSRTAALMSSSLSAPIFSTRSLCPVPSGSLTGGSRMSARKVFSFWMPATSSTRSIAPTGISPRHRPNTWPISCGSIVVRNRSSPTAARKFWKSILADWNTTM